MTNGAPMTGSPREDDVQGHALSCGDAKTLAALHLTTALALYGLGDSTNGAYFAGQARGLLQGSC